MTLPYKVQVWGGCMGEWMPDGTLLKVDPASEIAPRDFVHCVFTPGDHPWNRLMESAPAADMAGVVRMLMGWAEIDGEVIILLGQITPPVVAPVPLSMIEALHRVSGAFGGSRNMTEADSAALRLIEPFLGNKAIEPINPEWRPVAARDSPSPARR